MKAYQVEDTKGMVDQMVCSAMKKLTDSKTIIHSNNICGDRIENVNKQMSNNFMEFKDLNSMLLSNGIDDDKSDDNSIDSNTNRIETLEAILFSLVKSLEKAGVLSESFLNRNKKYLTEYENSAKTEISKFRSLMDNVLKLKNIIKNF